MRKGPGLLRASLGTTPGASKVEVGKGWGWAEGVAGVDLTQMAPRGGGRGGGCGGI